jgi:hypothetical protein
MTKKNPFQRIEDLLDRVDTNPQNSAKQKDTQVILGIMNGSDISFVLGNPPIEIDSSLSGQPRMVGQYLLRRNNLPIVSGGYKFLGFDIDNQNCSIEYVRYAPELKTEFTQGEVGEFLIKWPGGEEISRIHENYYCTIRFGSPDLYLIINGKKISENEAYLMFMEHDHRVTNIWAGMPDGSVRKIRD